MAYRLNPDIESCGAAPIPTVVSWVQTYRQSDKQLRQPMIHLAPGHPSHLPHPSLVERIAQNASTEHVARYGLGEGDDVLRQAILQEMKELYADNEDASPSKGSVDLSVDNVVVTLGANQAIYVALQTLAQAGDEVILCEPYYFNMHMALQQLGIKPVKLVLDPANGFLPSVEACQRCISSKTRAIMLVSPCNPTGAVLPSALAADFAALAHCNKVALVLDETYRDLMPKDWEGHESAGRRPKPHSLFGAAHRASLGSHWSDYLVHVYSFSKSYAIPGYRLGALVASPKLLEQALKIIDTQTICPARVAQEAVAWAIPNTRRWREDMRADLNERLEVFCEAIGQLEGWSVGNAGGYYAWVQHPFEHLSSAQVVKAMIEQCGVSALPGSFFAAEDSPAGRRWMRFSVPNVDIDTIKQVAPRLAQLQL